MSPLTTPPLLPPPRQGESRVWSDQDVKAMVVGIIGVIMVHVLLWFLAPFFLRFDPVGVLNQPHNTVREFNIEIAPNVFAKEKQPEQPDFVETNPDAPENTPDKTPNFSSRNQQVAQEKPTPHGMSDRPALEGQKDFDSTQIVSGQLAQPFEHIEAVAAPLVPPSTASADAPRAEQNPLPGQEKLDGKNDKSYGSNIARIPENPRPIPEKIEGAKGVPLIEGAVMVEPMIDPKRPRPRPQVVSQQRVRPAILAENTFGTSNIGNVAADAKWSNYGAYLQRFLDTVQMEWDRILIESKSYPPSPSFVTVSFLLNAEGRISKIVDVDNQSSEYAAQACVSSITNRMPYGIWTDDMKAVLGEQQKITITFRYQ